VIGGTSRIGLETARRVRAEGAADIAALAVHLMQLASFAG
jgi:NAD(P)-dependent dehydrogenase (short-subunit alcohol dehydrogenase family)